jgi:hypothetical protein
MRRHAADYFAISPQIQGKFLTATLITQGSIAPIGVNLLYPAIAVNARQQGAMVFTLVGPNNYPSSAFVPINNTTAGPVQISRAGNEPEDGFTGYRAFGGMVSPAGVITLRLLSTAMAPSGWRPNTHPI